MHYIIHYLSFASKIILVFTCIISTVLCISCSRAPENTEGLKLTSIEIDGHSVQLIMDSTSMFNNGEPNFNHDSLIMVIGAVYKDILELFDSKYLSGNIKDLYLEVKKDTCWIIDTNFILPPDHINIDNCATYHVLNDGKIILIVIG